MTTYYADSSALVKRYVTETGSAWVQTLLEPAAGHVIALANIGLVEIAAALAVKERQGVLPAPVKTGLLRDLEHDSQAQYWLIDIDNNLIAQAIALTNRQKVRGYDAVHLACALFLQETLLAQNLPAPVFLCADEELLEAARAEGLSTDNPHHYP